MTVDVVQNAFLRLSVVPDNLERLSVLHRKEKPTWA